MTFCGCVGSFVGVLSLNSRLSSYAKRGRKVIREMSGHIGDLSSEQELTLKKFRERVDDLLKPEHDDVYLLRWLRARKFDLDKSEQMLRRHMDCRQKWDLDNVVGWEPPEVLSLYQPGEFFGEDREGYPVYYDVTGNMDFKGLLKSAKRYDIIKKLLRNGEICTRVFEEHSKKHGKIIDLVTVVMDLNGVGLHNLWKPALDLFIEIARLSEQNYPERLKATYVINAPKLMSVLYGMVQPFLAEETRTKIHVLGRDWRDVLLKHIHPDQLPVHYGGNATGPDDDVTCGICQGGIVPKQYYLFEKSHWAKDNPLRKTATVTAGHTLDIVTEVPEAGSVIWWGVKTDSHDVGCGLFYRGSSNLEKEMEVILPVERADCSLAPEESHHLCGKKGTYVLKFDNSHSFIRSKKVIYYVYVQEPEQTDS